MRRKIGGKSLPKNLFLLTLTKTCCNTVNKGKYFGLFGSGSTKVSEAVAGSDTVIWKRKHQITAAFASLLGIEPQTYRTDGNVFKKCANQLASSSHKQAKKFGIVFKPTWIQLSYHQYSQICQNCLAQIRVLGARFCRVSQSALPSCKQSGF